MRPLARLLAGFLLVLSTVAGALVLTSAPAAACSCVEPTIDLLDTSDVAFSGVVTKHRASRSEFIVTVRTDAVFKGEVTKRVDVVSAGEGDTCSLGAQEGERFVVFGQLVDGEVTSNLCTSVSAQEEYYDPILADLGEGTEPSPGYTKVERGRLGLSYDQFVAGRAVLGVVGLAFLAYFAYRFWRARRRTA